MQGTSQQRSIRQAVVAAKITCLEMEIRDMQEELTIKHRLLTLKEWEYSDYLIEQAALQRTSFDAVASISELRRISKDSRAG